MTTDKRRIDACLKACEWISTQNLEDNVPFLELARRYNVVLRERDALRSAVRHEADCVEACKSEIDALRANITEMERQEPVAAQHRFRHPQKTMPNWSMWQPCAISNRPAWEIDWQGYEVEYRPLYALPGAKGESE